MSEGLLAVALGAGMRAAVDPCGFALLPAYVSLLVAGDDSPDRSRAVLRALGLTGAMTLGFSGVFLVFGLAVAPVVSQVQRHLPWVTVVLGVALALVGAWLVAGRRLGLPALPRLGRRPRRARPLQRSFWSMTGFGAGYAVASLSCTVAGAYVAYYGWWELRILGGADAADDPVIGAAAELQRAIVDVVDVVDVVGAVGPGGWALVVLALVGLTLVVPRLRRRAARTSARPAEPAAGVPGRPGTPALVRGCNAPQAQEPPDKSAGPSRRTPP
ncbi:cytochrome c biogenesis protein CcdA [Nocardioides sp. 31GB23]|uniref:cytochrome c biogenesis CcdA family protein n=1 Tax=Nocardioides sp. 31GB23 TaxID=3156065 RepID=UPI0032B00061